MGTTPAFKSDLKASKPRRNIFDAWNSSSTGHQRAENRLSGSTAWRDSRTMKLSEQLSDVSHGGGKRTADTVGAGSEHYGKDGRLGNGGWERGASGLRPNGQLSLFECNSRSSKPASRLIADSKSKPDSTQEVERPEFAQPDTTDNIDRDSLPICDNREDELDSYDPAPPSAQPYTLPSTPQKPPQIFANLTIYINGSTYPTIGDHRLKRLLVSHGASLSLSHARRAVTHVILGDPARCGGGLAASKLQKEIAVGRAGVRFVSAEWVVECVRVGRRVGEGRFQVVRTGGVGQRGVAEILGR